MQLAMREAEKARGHTSPNPFVGAIIVKDGKILAKGRTQSYGSDHAEVDALTKAGAEAKGASMYVTLEPCCHYGKTPPCTKAIIKAGIRKVIIGIEDPNPLVAGKGIEELRTAGIEVVEGVLSEAIRTQNEAFLCHIQKQRPFVIWKAALSLDGKFAANDGSSQWITNEAARSLVHRYRAQSDAVLSGIRSVQKDDAMLNARGIRGAKQPLRVVLDPLLELNPRSRFALCAKDYPGLVFYHSAEAPRAEQLASLGLELVKVAGNESELELNEVMNILHQRGVNTLFLETGNILSEAFLRARLVDKCLIFYGNKIIGGKNAILSGLDLGSIHNAWNLRDTKFKKLGDNLLLSGYPVYDPSKPGLGATYLKTLKP